MRLRRGWQGREPARVVRPPAVHSTLTPRSCAAQSSSLTPAGKDYACYVTCASTLGAQTLDTMQSNVVIVAPGYRSGVSYTSCRYSGGGVWCGEGPQFDLTHAASTIPSLARSRRPRSRRTSAARRRRVRRWAAATAWPPRRPEGFLPAAYSRLPECPLHHVHALAISPTPFPLRCRPLSLCMSVILVDIACLPWQAVHAFQNLRPRRSQ